MVGSESLKMFCRFVFVGLGHLMEHLLISNDRHLRVVNNFGVKKILRNILALQQSIKTVTNEQKNTEFERAKRYYSLYFDSPAVSWLYVPGEVSQLIYCLIGHG